MASGFTGDVAKERLPEEMSGVTQLSFSDLVIDESRMLGSGAFSKVYSALLTTAGSEEKTLVAVKKMPIPPIGNKLHKYLSTELRVLSGLSHENLVKYYGLAVDESHVYIVTELMRGGDLGAVLAGARKSGNQTKTFPTGLRIRVARDIAAGIDYMHINEIVHRDIKTENVLLDEEWRPVLADYGFARKVDTKRNMTIVGTDEFMAPEVIWGEPYDERADVFSFGVVLAELFSGKNAGEDGFMVRTPRGKFKLDEEQVVKAIAEGSPDAPERLSELVMECLAYEPDDRCASTDALEVLGQILEEWKELHPDDESAWDVKAVRRPSVIAREGAKEGCAPAGTMSAEDVTASGAVSPSTAEAAAMAIAAIAAAPADALSGSAAASASSAAGADHG